MKKLLLILSICSFASLSVFAQPGRGEMPDLEKNPEIRKKIEAYRTAYFTEKLELTPQEAEAFWPLFREMNERKHSLKKTYKPKKHRPDLANATDAEIKSNMKRHFEFKQKALDLEKEYAYKFIEVLPVKKAARLPMLEQEFKRTILREFKKRKGEDGGPHKRSY